MPPTNPVPRSCRQGHPTRAEAMLMVCIQVIGATPRWPWPAAKATSNSTRSGHRHHNVLHSVRILADMAGPFPQVPHRRRPTQQDQLRHNVERSVMSVNRMSPVIAMTRHRDRAPRRRPRSDSQTSRAATRCQRGVVRPGRRAREAHHSRHRRHGSDRTLRSHHPDAAAAPAAKTCSIEEPAQVVARIDRPCAARILSA